MFHFFTSRQRRHEVLHHFKHIGGFIWRIICTVLGAVGFVLISITIYLGIYKVRGPADPALLAMLTIAGIFAFLFFLLGPKVIRDTVRAGLFVPATNRLLEVVSGVPVYFPESER